MTFKRSVVLILLLSLTLSLAGCKTDEVPAEQPTAETLTVTPEPAVNAAPAPLLTGVETGRKVVCLIFEGFTDSTTMEAIADVLKQRAVPATFFVSGISANENPQLVRELAARGFAIGSYGMSGGKDLEQLSAYENMRRFEMAQKEIQAACGKVPELIRCNSTDYTEAVLRAVSAAGLKAAVEPTAYLNHRSFRTQEDAETFAANVLCGSILSVKLGQELDESEYDDLGQKLDERPAIDPGPGIRWEWSSVEERYVLLPDIVAWLVDALKDGGYSFTDPESLQSEKRLILRKVRGLSPEEQSLLDPANYPLPLTEHPLSAGETREAVPGDFDGAVFVGDLVMEGLQSYVEWKRKDQPAYLDDAQFLTDSHFTIETLLDGGTESGSLGDSLGAMHAKSVWLSLGFSDQNAFRRKAYLAKHRLLIKEIREKNPDIRIVVMPVLPKVERYAGISNRARFELNMNLCAMCREYALAFCDIASVVRDAEGQLREDYCLDLASRGSHLNDEGCKAVLDYIMENYPV